MTQLTIFHNPNCSKSRGAIALLEEKQLDFNCINYLTNPPSYEQLAQIIESGVSVREIVRTQEEDWIEMNIDLSELSTPEIIQLLMAHPKIMQRPIIIYDGKAIIARPPEKILELI